MTVREEIDQKLDWMECRLADVEERLAVASDAGAALAATVDQFLRYPETAVSLRVAYGAFMSLHAGNFVVSEPTIVGPTLAVRCPQCGAEPGEACRYVYGDGTAAERPGTVRCDLHFYRTALPVGAGR